MTKQELEVKVIELEYRIRMLEARPMYPIPQIPYVPQPFAPPYTPWAPYTVWCGTNSNTGEPA